MRLALAWAPGTAGQGSVHHSCQLPLSRQLHKQSPAAQTTAFPVAQQLQVTPLTCRPSTADRSIDLHQRTQRLSHPTPPCSCTALPTCRPSTADRISISASASSRRTRSCRACRQVNRSRQGDVCSAAARKPLQQHQKQGYVPAMQTPTFVCVDTYKAEHRPSKRKQFCTLRSTGSQTEQETLPASAAPVGACVPPAPSSA